MEKVLIGEYGIVVIVDGKHTGVAGYYDDDETEEISIVYVGTTLFEDVVFVPREHLRKAPSNIALLAVKRFAEDNPEEKDYLFWWNISSEF